MATTPIKVVADRNAVKYDGLNSADIAALIADFTVTAETATALTFTSDAVSYTVPAGGWITYWEGAVREEPFANDDDFRDVYRTDDLEEAHYHEITLTSGPALPLD